MKKDLARELLDKTFAPETFSGGVKKPMCPRSGWGGCEGNETTETTPNPAVCTLTT